MCGLKRESRSWLGREKRERVEVESGTGGKWREEELFGQWITEHDYGRPRLKIGFRKVPESLLVGHEQKVV